MKSVELVKLIETAFKNVTLGNGVGIFEAEAIDNYASDKKTAKARAKDREQWTNWIEIPAQVIEVFYSALCFVDAEGMRFLLPAYMKFAIENNETSTSASVDSPIYALDRGYDAFDGNLDILTKEQRNAIAQFLKFMVLDVGDDFVDSQFASSAFERYSSKYEADA